MPAAGSVTITLKKSDGNSQILKENLALEEGEVIDATRLSKAALCSYFEKEMNDSF